MSSAQWDWDSYWEFYKANPEALQKDVDTLPNFLRGKSTRIQIEIMKNAPKKIIHQMINYLTFDCQIALMK